MTELKVSAIAPSPSPSYLPRQPSHPQLSPLSQLHWQSLYCAHWSVDIDKEESRTGRVVGEMTRVRPDFSSVDGELEVVRGDTDYAQTLPHLQGAQVNVTVLYRNLL